jgi:hypothetical protein
MQRQRNFPLLLLRGGEIQTLAGVVIDPALAPPVGIETVGVSEPSMMKAYDSTIRSSKLVSMLSLLNKTLRLKRNKRNGMNAISVKRRLSKKKDLLMKIKPELNGRGKSSGIV